MPLRGKAHNPPMLQAPAGMVILHQLAQGHQFDMSRSANDTPTAAKLLHRHAVLMTDGRFQHDFSFGECSSENFRISLDSRWSDFFHAHEDFESDGGFDLMASAIP